MAAFDLNVTCATEAALTAFATRLAPLLTLGDCLLLSGPVGAGKSVLARAIIQTLQRQAGQTVDEVTSPTFTILQTYSAGALTIIHADLYRLERVEDLIETGLPDMLPASLSLIEWPDLIEYLVPWPTLYVMLSIQPSGARQVHLSSAEPSWSARLRDLANG